jgi:hypothetical protein
MRRQRVIRSILLAALSMAVAGQRSLQVQPVTRLAPPAKRWAILIGIDRYENTNISPLIGAANTMLRTT